MVRYDLEYISVICSASASQSSLIKVSCNVLNRMRDSYPSSCTIQRQSIHMYWISIELQTLIASRKDCGRLERAIPVVCSSNVARVVINGCRDGGPQQWLRATYGLTIPEASISRTVSVDEEDRSNTLLAGIGEVSDLQSL